MTLFEEIALGGLGGVVVVAGVVNYVGKRVRVKDSGGTHYWKWDLLNSLLAPVTALFLVAVLNWAIKPLLATYLEGSFAYWLPRIDDFLVLVVAIITTWGSYRCIEIVEAKLSTLASHTGTLWDDFCYAFGCICLRAAIPPAFISYLIYRLQVSPKTELYLSHIPTIAMIVAWTYVLYATAALIEDLVVKSGVKPDGGFESRRTITRVRLIRQIFNFLITMVALAALLMIFKEARSLGTSLLASAGVFTVVLGLAAQRTFGTIFAGIQIALSQPIRLGDQVVVQKEFGTVEEITLTYVVVQCWDLRRLVLPISYFIEQPFENWTRTSTNVIGTVLLEVDFATPVDALRQELQRIVENSKYWNKNTCVLHVTDSDQQCMQVRLIASARTAGETWELRCEIREKMIEFIRRNYPDCLPKRRIDHKSIADWQQAVNGVAQSPKPDVPETPDPVK